MLFIFPLCPALLAGQAVQIASSNCPTATAFNNARKIARTFDDRRIVVYQDYLNDHEVVKISYSDDGMNWTEASLLAYGFSPTIAVSDADTIYVSWLTHDRDWPAMAKFYSHNVPSTPLNSPPDSHATLHDPVSVCLEVDDSYVHQLYHFFSVDSSISRIHYSIYSKDLRWLGVSGYLNKTAGRAEMPTMACDLEYLPGPVHITWTEDNEWGSEIKYAVIYPDIFKEHDWLLSLDEYLDMGFLETLEGSQNLSAASLSARVSPLLPDVSMLIGAFNNSTMNGMTVKCWDVFRENDIDINVIQSGEHHIDGIGPACPSVDDVIMPERSCAIIWHNNGTILYGQTKGATIKTQPPALVNTTGSSARHPNVCYKTFRSDKFDVVWTEGTAAPFEIMYRRMRKDYSQIFAKMQILTTELPTGTVGQDYSAIVEVNYADRHKGNIWSMIAGQLPQGLYMAPYTPEHQGNLTILGTPEKAGESSFALCVTHPVFPPEDYICLADTADFTITVKRSVAIQKNASIIPSAYRLFPAQPNPFNSTTRIRFTVPVRSQVTISIFDIGGNFVQQLYNAERAAGNFYIPWNASDLASGVYIIRLQADEFISIQKCLLIR